MATPMGQFDYHRQITIGSQWLKIPYPTTSFAGQVIIVTGSNTSVGLEAARHIVRLGAAKVVLAVRNMKAGEDAATGIIQTTGVKSNVVEVWNVDLTSYQSIQRFAERTNKLDRLDAVLQNAGIAGGGLRRTESGEEIIFGTNTIGAVLLGLLVLPKLRESAERFSTRGRLAFTGSESYLLAKFNEVNTKGSLLEAMRDEDLFIANKIDRCENSAISSLLHTKQLPDTKLQSSCNSTLCVT